MNYPKIGKYQKNKNLFTINGNGKFENLDKDGFKGEFNQGKYFINKDTVELYQKNLHFLHQ